MRSFEKPAPAPPVLVALAVLTSLVAAPAAPAQPRPGALLVVAVEGETSGAIATVEARRPWTVRRDLVAVGRRTVLTVAGERVFALSPEEGRLRQVDVRRGRVLRTVPLDPAGDLQDVAVVGRRAYVTRLRATHLLRVDLATGAATAVVDLSPFADADGIPEMSGLAVDGSHLFVQLRRVDPDGFPTEPALLAVVDLARERLVDVDPSRPGTQAIELAGTAAKHPMTVLGERRRLVVGATGREFDAGGLELVDLDRLRSRGLLVREADGLTGSDLGAFAMLGPRRGFLVFTTDLLLSSHLHRFDPERGVDPEELAVTVDYFAPALVIDPRTRLLFFPDGSASPPGIVVLKAGSGERLTPRPLDVGGRPTDLVLVGR